MKKLTIQVSTITLAIMAFTVTVVYAQKRIILKNGKAKVSATVKANDKITFTVSGKDFRQLSIRQTKGGKFKYEIRRGSEFLSSGHSGFFSKVRSDRRSLYSITILNNDKEARGISIVFQDVKIKK